MCVDRKGAEMKNCPDSHQKERRKRDSTRIYGTRLHSVKARGRLKGTGSRDRIHILGQKSRVLVIKKNLY
jgi:hypothetical protein